MVDGRGQSKRNPGYIAESGRDRERQRQRVGEELQEKGEEE